MTEQQFAELLEVLVEIESGIGSTGFILACLCLIVAIGLWRER